MDIGVSPSVGEPPSPGVVVRTPITFFGMAQARERAEIDEFLTDPDVIGAVQSVRGAKSEAQRLTAVKQLMEKLG